MSFATDSSRKLVFSSLPFPNVLPEPEQQLDREPVTQEVDLVATDPAPPFPAFLSPSSLRHITQTPYSPPFTPPNLIPSSFYELNTRSYLFTPSTPNFSAIPEHDSEADPFAPSFSRNTSVDYSCPRTELDPYALPFVPNRSHFSLPPKHMHPHSVPRTIPPPLILAPLRHRPHPSHSAKSDRILTTTTVNATDAHNYSPHFPPGRVLNRDFVHKYAPGAQIGVGAFGFVVTARDRLLGHEAAVKFIEKSKVPQWGWSNDPKLGRIPTEAMMLKLLDHPGIIKFLDLFQDKDYFYLVQELHGSPWRGKQVMQTAGLRQTGPSAPNTVDEVMPFAYPVVPGSAMLPQSLGTVASNSHDDLSRFTLESYPPSSSSSTFSSPPCSPVSPVTPASPMTPPPETRPNMGRRLSHDLFECIEEHQRLSESQARYIFAQVVDIVYYLDGIGVTHRDIKDENVLVDRAFHVKLIDFGAASCVDPRIPGPRPWYRHFRGTVAYAPSEIIREAKCHQAEPADVWALGVLLSYLITGRSAFPTAADAAQGRIVLHDCKVRTAGEARPLVHQESTISAECWDLLTRCLDPDPCTRARIAELKAHPWLEGALV